MTFDRFSERLAAGARTPEGKVIAFFMAVCISLMTWNVATLGYAVSEQGAVAGEPVEQDAGIAGLVVEDDQVLRAEGAESASFEGSFQQEGDYSGYDHAGEVYESQDSGADASGAGDAGQAPEDAEGAAPDMPAQEFVATVGGVTVTVQAPHGAFPLGAAMRVAPVVASNVIDAVEAAVDGDVSTVKAVDMSFLFEGDQIQPQQPVTVTFSDAGLQGDDVHVFRVAGDGSMLAVSALQADADAQSFVIDESATYVAASVQPRGQEDAQGPDGQDDRAWPSGEASASSQPDAAVQHQVTFYVQAEDGTDQAVRTEDVPESGTVGALPENPFKPGSRFMGWFANVADGAKKRVTSETVVDSDLQAYAEFASVGAGSVRVEYYYVTPEGEDVTFDAAVIEAGAASVPSAVESPANVAVGAEVDAESPVYYPEQQQVAITEEDMAQAADGNQVVKRVRYAPRTADFDYVYYLQNLDGQGYAEIDRASAQGMLGAKVTAPVKDFPYASFESAEEVTIDRESGVQVPVYYTRKSFTLVFDSAGGSAVDDMTAPFGTTVDLSAIEPMRAGGDFAGWYLDEGLSQPAGDSLFLDGDARLYASWTGDGATAAGVPTLAHYDFAGWWTQPEGGELYGWSKPASGTEEVYARWLASPLSYTVRYLDDQTGQALYPEKTVTGPALQAGQQVREEAVALAGRRPDMAQKSLQLAKDGNVIEFRYASAGDPVGYRVEYVLASDPAVHVAADKTVEDVDSSMASAVEAAVAVDRDYMRQQGCAEDVLAADYYPLEDAQDLVLGANAEGNVITFLYADYRAARVVVNYLDMDGEAIPGAPQSVEYAKVGDAFVLPANDPVGYTRDHVESSQGEGGDEYLVAGGGDLVVNVYCKRDVTVAASGKQKEYDGSPLESRGVGDLAPGTRGLVAGDAVTSIAFDGSQTEVGMGKTTPRDAAITRGGVDVTYYYDIAYVPAVLDVR